MSLTSKWVLWVHLPTSNDWQNINSYENVCTFEYLEEVIALMELIPAALIENCMLFLMKEGIKPMWEDPKNIKGGCFAYKIHNKHIVEAWKTLSYVVTGDTVSNNNAFNATINGITISPKKQFCIMKIWTSGCNFQSPNVISSTDLTGVLSKQGCLFKNHV